MIRSLRQDEAVILYENILNVPQNEEQQISDFLKNEYANEALEYPGTAPAFDAAAALWAAKLVNVAAQLILYRKNKPAELLPLLPDYPGPHTSAAILSADLCLRFVPDMLVQLKVIDNEDDLIEILENKLTTWHYSGINYKLDVSLLNFDTILSDACLKQLYVDRIIRHKKMQLALHPLLKNSIQAAMGMYANEFWNSFNTEMKIDG